MACKVFSSDAHSITIFKHLFLYSPVRDFGFGLCSAASAQRLCQVELEQLLSFHLYLPENKQKHAVCIVQLSVM
jgi:hypothetical protein